MWGANPISSHIYHYPLHPVVIMYYLRLPNFLMSKASELLLNYIYPDELLFSRAQENSSVQGPSAKRKYGQSFTVDNALQQCRKLVLYGKLKKGHKNDMWISNCPELGPRAPTEREAPLALFFNSVLSSIQTACNTMEYMYVMPLLVLNCLDQLISKGMG